MPLSGCSASQASTALPKPYQPGSISRHCAQLNTQGMARRSSISRVFLRDAGRLPMFSVGDLGDDRGCPEIIGETLGLVDQPAIGLEGQRRQLLHRLQIFRPTARCAWAAAGSLPASRRPGFRDCAADLGVGIFAGDDFALLGDPDLAVHRAARLRDDGVIARAAAAADRAAAAVEQPQPHMVALEHFDQADLGLVELPARGDEAAVLVAVGIAEHHLLHRAAAVHQLAVVVAATASGP